MMDVVCFERASGQECANRPFDNSKNKERCIGGDGVEGKCMEYLSLSGQMPSYKRVLPAFLL